MPLTVLCDRLLDEVTGARCRGLEGHNGPCFTVAIVTGDHLGNERTWINGVLVHERKAGDDR